MQPTKRLCSKAPNKVHGVTFVEDTMEDDGERLVSTLPPPTRPFPPCLPPTRRPSVEPQIIVFSLTSKRNLYSDTQFLEAF